MSWSSLLTGILNAVVSGSKTAASVAQDAGVSSLKVGGATISVSALATQLDTLAKAAPGDAILTSLHFTSAKDFLLSQQFESDIVLVADLLGVIGLAVPAAAVASSDLRTIAMILTVAHSLANGLIALGLFTDLVPVNGGAAGYVSKAWAANPHLHYDPKTGRFL